MRQVRQWQLLTLILMAAFLVGCQTKPTPPPTTLQILEQSEAAVTAGWDMLGQAIQIETVPINSERHVQFYTLLDRADQMLDAAWDLYTEGDDMGARTQADIARSLYLKIRPLLVEAAGGA